MTREYNRDVREYQGREWINLVSDQDQQTAICTSDQSCQAAADEHNPDCPIEQSLQDEFGGF